MNFDYIKSELWKVHCVKLHFDKLAWPTWKGALPFFISPVRLMSWNNFTTNFNKKLQLDFINFIFTRTCKSITIKSILTLAQISSYLINTISIKPMTTICISFWTLMYKRYIPWIAIFYFFDMKVMKKAKILKLIKINCVNPHGNRMMGVTSTHLNW